MTNRFTRVKKKWRLTVRDGLIVNSVFDARYLTLDQIQRLYFSSPTRCKERVRNLFNDKYLNKRNTYLTEPDVFYLGMKGRRYLCATYGIDSDYLEKVGGVSGGEDRIPLLMMDHELTLSGFYVFGTLECRRFGWEFEWKNTRMLELLHLGIQPDAYFKVSNNGNYKEAFIEYTAAITGKTELKKKVEAYETFYQSSRPVMVLWVTTTLLKLKTIYEVVRESPYKSYFLLGLKEKMGDFLTKVIWKWPETDETVCFLKSPAEALRDLLPRI